MSRRIRIATRGSDLARWQAEWVAGELGHRCHVQCDLVVVRTTAEAFSERPLREIEGVGHFTSALQEAVRNDQADLAVHSYKDLPTAATPGLVVAAAPVRHNPADWLLIRGPAVDATAPVWPLGDRARVGTSSLRRQFQLRYERTDLQITDLRGNVPTRVQRLRSGDFDAIVLAAAGLERLRLELSDLTVVDLLAGVFLPAPAQGALAVECRDCDTQMTEMATMLDDPRVSRCVAAERALLRRFAGGCNLALGCLAECKGDRVDLRAVWMSRVDDRRIARCDGTDTERVAQEVHAALTADFDG